MKSAHLAGSRFSKLAHHAFASCNLDKSIPPEQYSDEKSKSNDSTNSSSTSKNYVAGGSTPVSKGRPKNGRGTTAKGVLNFPKQYKVTVEDDQTECDDQIIINGLVVKEV